MTKIPEHIGIIMDGNGRWAKARGLARTAGHQAGAETLKSIVRAADAMGVKVLTVYAFSTENWQRPKLEVDFIMRLLGVYLIREIPDFNANNVQVRFVGDRGALPEYVTEKLDNVLRETKKNTGIILNLAINYGSRAELISVMRQFTDLAAQGKLESSAITEKMVTQNLYTAGLPEPDLIIRTGGEMRLSNFLLWQAAYAEIWVTDTFWPDFTPDMLQKAVTDYNNRQRRFGGLGD